MNIGHNSKINKRLQEYLTQIDKAEEGKRAHADEIKAIKTRIKDELGFDKQITNLFLKMRKDDPNVLADKLYGVKAMNEAAGKPITLDLFAKLDAQEDEDQIEEDDAE